MPIIEQTQTPDGPRITVNAQGSTPVARQKPVATSRRANWRPNEAQLSKPTSISFCKELDLRLQRAVQVSSTSEELRLHITQAVAVCPGITGNGWATVQKEQAEFVDHNLQGPVFERDEIQAWIRESAIRVASNGKPEVVSSPLVRNLKLIARPINLSDNNTPTIFMMLPAGEDRSSDAEAASSLVLAWSAFWKMSREIEVTNRDLMNSAMMVELCSDLTQCMTTREFGNMVVSQLRKHFDCDTVGLGVVEEESRVKPVAITGHRDFDLRSTTAEELRNAFEETVARKRLTCWPPLSHQEQFLTRAHRRITETGRAESIVTAPLKNRAEETVGTLTVLGKKEIVGSAAVIGLIDALSEPLGIQLDSIKRKEGGPVRRVLRRVADFVSSKKMLIVGGVLAAAFVAMLVPVPFHIWCDAELQPTERRFSVAPHDGLLETTMVEPGDVVEPGQLLAKMDGRQVRWEMAGATAGLHKAARESNAYLAEYNVPESVIAQLEKERMQHEVSVLQFRENNLEVRAPIAGVVLDGSLDRRENYPVNTGDVLYEIAPLGSLRAEIYISDEDISHVREGLTVDLYVHGFENELIEATITRIRPRSEIHDDQNVFVAELLIDNPTGRIRPGMTASSRIHADSQQLWWILFHKPLERISTLLTW